MAAARYIPGLTPRPVDNGEEEMPNSAIPKDVPPELIEAFKNGAKQPISALMEYCAMQRHTATFKEVPVKSYSLVNKFANECSVDDISYPQGTGKTKKDAKTNAAFIAFNIILGDETFEDYGEETPSNLQGQLSHQSAAKGFPPVTHGASGEYQPPPQKRDLNRILEEYLRKCGKPGGVQVLDGPFGFIGKVTIGGRVVSEETAKTKREAREMALETALEALLIGEHLVRKDHWEDLIAKECYRKLEDLISQCRSADLHQARHSFAAFIINRGLDSLKPEMVAFGTGNSCLSGEHLKMDGRMLIDSYAVAVARRALLKYFHKEIKSYLEGNTVTSIFEESCPGGKFRFKPHVTLHLFLNNPPPGDYRDCLEIACEPLTHENECATEEGAHFPAFTEQLPGWFSVKNEDGVIECVEEDQAPIQNLEDVETGDLLVMSCSDKLLLWNTVGLQGGLFSTFMLPVYVNSIILGREYHHGHLSRAVCCRLYDVVNRYLPNTYRLHHPNLSSGTLHIEEMEGKGTSLSINWSLADELPEIVEGFTGKVTDSSPSRSTKNPGPCASRLCKAGFLFRFRELGRMLKSPEIAQAANYQEAKQMDRDYQEAKRIFRSFTHKIGLGHWIQKPREIEQFAS
ncbi:double-stranded RNA-specific editase 1-like [Dreissena polymorpha]|uniref:double-stranded RNA-specific editase 1-like n=1 Tax=Dreissena polymorpha TaxID=45954 RepID=UPI002263AE21|nr:double-stranded RNA-specific editase 1-like [Dreissena polymorpha]XP_052228578.1 double-stranded RNA-specific editase 1-like [Dreissena polymorpha]